ncbi:MAG: ABC transporter permease [Candidatus Dependentiae bacterium]
MIKRKLYLLLPLFVCGVYLFLYIPMFILVLMSFNASAHFHVWGGFSLQWYRQLLESVEVWNALQNSLIVAMSAVALSLSMGTLLVFYTKDRMKKMNLLFYGTLAAPEIVLAVGLLSLLVYFMIPLGLTSLIVGHTLIGLGYVVPMLYARMQEMDNSLIEAAMDLGATQTYALYSVVLPFLMPSLIGAGLLVFIISFDDFVVAFFCAGASAQTLPLYIFSVIRSGATPMINALSTLLLCVSSLLVLLFSLFTLRKTGIQS